MVKMKTPKHVRFTKCRNPGCNKRRPRREVKDDYVCLTGAKRRCPYSK